MALTISTWDSNIISRALAPGMILVEGGYKMWYEWTISYTGTIYRHFLVCIMIIIFLIFIIIVMLSHDQYPFKWHDKGMMILISIMAVKNSWQNFQYCICKFPCIVHDKFYYYIFRDKLFSACLIWNKFTFNYCAFEADMKAYKAFTL